MGGWVGLPLPKASHVALVVKNLSANAGDVGEEGLIPGSGRSPGGEHGNPLQYACRENSKGRGDWWATGHGSQRIGRDQGNLSHTHMQQFQTSMTKSCLHLASGGLSIASLINSLTPGFSWPLNFFFFSGGKMYITKFTFLTIFKCKIQ